MTSLRCFASLLVLASLTACVTPPTSIHQPVSVRPPPPVANPQANGSIYLASLGKPLFEDRRARHVGDTITVNLVERTRASKASNSSASRGSSTELALPNITGIPLANKINAIGVEAASDSNFSGKGASAATNDFTGTITATVIEVYPNGNLLVSGEKQIAINQGQEFIRFSGVVNPTYVTGSNTIQSTQVADARVEYKANGYMDEAQTMGWLQRFFLNVLPW